ncbi:MAG: hypothetical protein WBO95_02905 [Candidatus Dechloromonas phosphoritropha]
MNNENLDLSAILAVIEPGYVVVMHGDGHQQILIVPAPMDVAPGVQGSVGFELDGTDGVIGRPVFLHRRMTIRHLGSLEDYLEEPFVQSVLGEVTRLIDRRLGVLPVIAVIEALRVDPDACIADVAAAVLERRRALWASASAS